ncbi:MAG TPA: nucleotide exchange factor GrpE [Candidatus Angelobacter sp.]|nr:nucleotide exchange factor GrpE [Candidatus Angelobacter sp.]
MVQEKKKDKTNVDPEEVGEETLSVIVDNDGTEQAAERDPEQVAADLARALADANAKIVELKDQNLRALAETENVRRRVQRDRDEALKFATTGLAKDLLPVADNLRRALDAIPKDALEKDEALRNFATGVEMTERLLLAALERHQIKRIEAVGQKFDANLHQAMFEVPGTGQPAGTVVQVLEAGYTIQDRLLRPALVGIAKADTAPSGGNGPAPATNGSGEPVA